MDNLKRKILIVEDEEDIQDLICISISDNNVILDTASDGQDAYNKIQKNKYDLIIMDWMIPEISGISLISWMKKPTHHQNKTPILMVTAKSDPNDIVLGLETGADDYMSKPFDSDVLKARVNNLLKRKDFLEKTEKLKEEDKNILKLYDLSLNKENHEATIKGEKLDLTFSEFKMLESLLLYQGKVLSRNKLSSFIQGENIVAVGRAIDTHISSLRKKLGEYGDRIKTVRGVGYRVSYD